MLFHCITRSDLQAGALITIPICCKALLSTVHDSSTSPMVLYWPILDRSELVHGWSMTHTCPSGKGTCILCLNEVPVTAPLHQCRVRAGCRAFGAAHNRLVASSLITNHKFKIKKHEAYWLANRSTSSF